MLLPAAAVLHAVHTLGSYTHIWAGHWPGVEQEGVCSVLAACGVGLGP